jgi:NTE family protein
MEPAASAAAARGPLRPRAGSSRAHRPFALVLSGGGARGLAHVGVLRALEHLGLRPSGIVGVSMGAIVGAVYALNEDWYDALVGVDVERLPGVANGSSSGPMGRLRSAVASGRAIGQMVLSWGTWAASEPTIRALLAEVTLGKAIDEGRIPFAAVATDLRTERRFVIERGSAADAIYASAALAGILPPHRQGDALLVDGVYADGAPVDVARGMGVEAVVAVDVNQRRPPSTPRNGLQALLRAVDIVHRQASRARFEEADLVLAPAFARPIEALDFGHHRDCVAAGARSVLARRADLSLLLAVRPRPARAVSIRSRLRARVATPRQRRPVPRG